jgi:RNA polymerase sigma factor (TIGR02999 family)
VSLVSTDPAERKRATELLQAAGEGDTLGGLFPIVYDELRRLAHRQLGNEMGERTLDTTDLVHEAYLRLVDESLVTQRGRAYFFAAAAQAMRRVLVDRARRRGAAKRGGHQGPLTLEEATISVDVFADQLVALDEALERLATLSPRQARVVECRYFGGLSVEETAEALEVSPRTVKSDWAMARAWLYNAIRDGA